MAAWLNLVLAVEARGICCRSRVYAFDVSQGNFDLAISDHIPLLCFQFSVSKTHKSQKNNVMQLQFYIGIMIL
jgi:hypothetical protein